jgi:hypothetical protein
MVGRLAMRSVRAPSQNHLFYGVLWCLWLVFYGVYGVLWFLVSGPHAIYTSVISVGWQAGRATPPLALYGFAAAAGRCCHAASFFDAVLLGHERFMVCLMTDVVFHV